MPKISPVANFSANPVAKGRKQPGLSEGSTGDKEACIGEWTDKRTDGSGGLSIRAGRSAGTRWRGSSVSFLANVPWLLGS